MVRCKEFYEKWEQAKNFCEKHPKTADKIEKYLDLIDEILKGENLEEFKKEPMSTLSESGVRPLIREKDPEVREKAIESVKKSLKTGKHPVTGRFMGKKERITHKDVEQIVQKEKPQEEPETCEIPAETLEETEKLEKEDFRKAIKKIVEPHILEEIKASPTKPSNEFDTLTDKVGEALIERDIALEEEKNDPAFQEYQRRRNILEGFQSGTVDKMACPICGSDYHVLKFGCHGLRLEKAKEIARRKFGGTTLKKVRQEFIAKYGVDYKQKLEGQDAS